MIARESASNVTSLVSGEVEWDKSRMGRQQAEILGLLCWFVNHSLVSSDCCSHVPLYIKTPSSPAQQL
jgi:hypothetical protein